ncbi:MAG: MlaD family protein [Bacteroidales bacterium]|jgi:phospholipid/cholesterol/gamma-HCH transport system substrate-binding protein|nr:MCE family protein [Bacteroidales bacterium]MEE0900312.1 MlaD family protein [Bacteroidales bacterium]MEE0918058.1 MlaD family protein [Bacteroidales bacterium]MEE0927340.1 MlaD family protein [Bacteroidales bacterium]MEE0992464.1 MlaD family protein [Bacteroidales bacterium]
MKTEIKIGIVGFGILLLLFFGIKFLKGIDVFQKETTYYVFYDNVSGMYEGNYIYLNGMKVGYVKDIEAMGERAEKFLVTVAVDSKIKITDDSKMVFFSADILGSKAMKIELGNSNRILENKDTIMGGVELGMLDKLGSSIAPMAQNLDSILFATKNILNQQTQNNLQHTFANLEATSERLSSISGQFDNLMKNEKEKIGKIISNTESITSNLKNNNDELNNIISKIGQITDTVAQAQLGSTILQTTQTLEKLNNVLGVIEKGKGNIGLLINDEGLYKSLDESAKKLDALIEDIKANPKKYINVSVF